MVSASVETLRLLASIDASLKLLVQQRAPTAAAVSDAVCNGPHGDPIIKAKDPRDWAGESMNGKRFSECPAEYLDLLAERYDFFAAREEDAKKRGYNELDAKRARAWAARKRAGWTAPAAAPDTVGEPTW